MPGAMAIGATGEPLLAEATAAATAKLLLSVGINMNLAPVADVNINPDNPVIGVRSYGEDPQAVSRFVAAAVRGCQAAGALATVKHFPGHGDTETDSHLALPVIRHQRERLESVELAPFRAAIAAGAGAIMSAHILFAAVARDGRPATLSGDVLTGLLRGELGFDGLIATDCMEMSAIVANYGSGEAAALAVRAGADLVLVSHTPERQRESYRAILAAVRSGDIPAEQVAASVRRILAAKQRYAAAAGAPLTRDQLAEQSRLALSIARRAVTVIRDSGNVLPLTARRPLCVAVGESAATKAESGPDEPAIAAAMSSHWPDLCHSTVKDDGTGLDRALAALADCDALIIAVAGLSAFPQRLVAAQRLLSSAGEHRIPVVTVACRAPYDALALSAASTLIASFDARPASLAAAAEVIAGQRVPTGQVPVTLAKSSVK
jgi:beta-N-acetylhexosaminidase